MKSGGSLREKISQIWFVFKHTILIVSEVNKGLVVSVFVLGIISGLTIIPSLYLDRLIIDTLIAGVGASDVRDTVFYIISLVFARLLISIFVQIANSFNRFLRRTLSWQLNMQIELLISRKNAELDLSTLEDSKFRDKYTKIERESSNRAFNLLMPLTDIPSALAGFISTIGILLVFSPLIAVGTILFSIPQIFFSSKFIRKWYDLSDELAPLNKVRGWLVYYLVRNNNFMELKLLDLPKHLTKKMQVLQRKIIKARMGLHKQELLSEVFAQLPILVFELIVSVWLVVQVVVAAITIGSFQLYLRALRTAQNDFKMLTSSLLSIFENYIYIADLIWFLELKPKVEINDGTRMLNTDNVTIEFRDVWFKYHDKQKWTLKNINFRINENENIALVGVNGAGKSTLIKLLTRFYDPTRGEILVNGINLKEYSISNWRKHLAVLFQEFESYPFTAKESIGYGDVENIANIGDIQLAAKLTSMHDYIMELPKGYNNPLDPQFQGGVRPSTGQRQRLGISRMLFRKNAEVIIMDEPTASVDPQAEEDIFKELVKHATEKILIFVTQRFSTVRLADRIFVMDDGKITEQGTHQELIEKDGKYAHLFKLQAKGYQ